MILHQQTLSDLIFFIPELFLTLATLALLMISLYDPYKSIQNQLYIVALAVEAHIITLALLIKNLNKNKLLLMGSFISDNYVVISKLFVISVTILFLLLTFNHLTIKQNIPIEFIILISFSTIATFLIIGSNDLIILYLSLEFQNLCLYILAAIKKTSRFSTEAGIKYFILGSLASTLFLFGLSLLYGFTGSTNTEEISYLISNAYNMEKVTSTLMYIGIIFVLCGFLFKLAIVPFHFWSLDVYEGAPILVTIFLMVVSKIGIFSIFTKYLFNTFFECQIVWQPILVPIATLTIVFASVAGLYQNKIKRLLTYSSIVNTGYLVLGLSTGTLTGLHAFWMYLITYVFTLLIFFSMWPLFKKNKRYPTYLIELKDNHLPPYSQIIFVTLLFSLAGIPPFIGFFMKAYLLFCTLEVNYYGSVICSIIASTISAFYYIRIIKIREFEKTVKNELNDLKGYYSPILLVLGALPILVFAIYPNFLFIKLYQLTLHI